MIASNFLPSYCLLRYKKAFFGSSLSLLSFDEQFPRIDTVNTIGSKESENARTEGTSNDTHVILEAMLKSRLKVLLLHSRQLMHVRNPLLLQTRRQIRTSSHHCHRMHIHHSWLHPPFHHPLPLHKNTYN